MRDLGLVYLIGTNPVWKSWRLTLTPGGQTGSWDTDWRSTHWPCICGTFYFIRYTLFYYVSSRKYGTGKGKNFQERQFFEDYQGHFSVLPNILLLFKTSFFAILKHFSGIYWRLSGFTDICYIEIVEEIQNCWVLEKILYFTELFTRYWSSTTASRLQQSTSVMYSSVNYYSSSILRSFVPVASRA